MQEVLQEHPKHTGPTGACGPAQDHAGSVTDCLSKLQELFGARASFDKESGKWQEATQQRNRHLMELRDWMDDFDLNAKVALYDKPQLLEVLGIFVRS